MEIAAEVFPSSVSANIQILKILMHSSSIKHKPNNFWLDPVGCYWISPIYSNIEYSVGEYEGCGPEGSTAELLGSLPNGNVHEAS